MINTNETLPAQKWPPITVAQAHAISAITDPALRNLRITQGYHDLKTALTRLFGARNVTWCAYATWASKTAGAFIRGEEAPKMMRDCLAGAHQIEALLKRVDSALGVTHPGVYLDGLLITDTIEEVIHDVTKGVGQGNLIVFQELAPLYAAWLETFKAPPPAHDRSVIDAFVASNLKPGPVQTGGQDLLIQAFRAYYDAMLENEGGRKAQHMLLANALVGYHEQTRLQGPIVAALNAPVADILFAKAKSRARRRLPSLVDAAINPVIEEVLRPLAEHLMVTCQKVATRCLMTLTLPGVVLALGEDIPPLSSDRMFPAELEIATLPPLVELLAKLDRTADTVVGSAAANWCDLGDRMNFVVDFFRTRQQDPALYRQPFMDEQVAVIFQGGMPRGAL